MTGSPLASTDTTCRECGASCSTSSSHCWMCQASLTQSSNDSIPLADMIERAPPHAPTETFFQVATLGVLVLIILVGVGLILTEPGAGIAYLLLIAPPLIGASIHIVHRERRDGTIRWTQRFTTLLLSAVIMASVLTAVVVALLVGLFIFCLVSVSHGGF